MASASMVSFALTADNIRVLSRVGVTFENEEALSVEKAISKRVFEVIAQDEGRPLGAKG